MVNSRLLVLLVGAERTFESRVHRAIALQGSECRLLSVASLEEAFRHPAGEVVEVLVMQGADRPEVERAAQALDALELPRWAVLAVGGPAGVSGVEVVDPGADGPLLSHILFAAAHRHQLTRELASCRGDLLTLGRRIHHDLRSPLGAILSTAEALRDTAAAGVAEREMARMISASAEQIASLTDRVVSVAKALARPPPRERLNMEWVVVAARERLERRLLDAGGFVEQPAAWPEVEGVGPWLETVWFNLLDNALRHGGVPPRIHLGWERLEGEYRFWISDEGPGVPEERRAELFQPFHLLHRPDATNGLGLSITRRLVEMHGGRCGCMNGPRGDFRFYFTLPLEPAVAHAPRPGPTPCGALPDAPGPPAASGSIAAAEESAAGVEGNGSSGLSPAARLAAIVEGSEDAIISKDLDGIIMSWNHGAEMLFGYKAEEVIGLPVRILIPNDRPDEGPGLLDRIRRGERIQHYETLRRRKDGSLVEVSISISPVRDGQGRIIGASKIARNITTWKATQESLRQRTRAVEVVSRISSALVAELDVEKLLQRVTEAARELSGAAFGVFYHRSRGPSGEPRTLCTVSGASPDALALLPKPGPADLHPGSGRGHAILRSDDVLRDPRFQASGSAACSGAGSAPIRSYLAVPIVGRVGEAAGTLCFAHPEPNVFTKQTEEVVAALAAQAAIALDNATLYAALHRELEYQKLVQSALRTSEARLSAVFEQAGVGIAQTDLTGRFLMVNERYCEIAGRPRTELLGMRMAEITDPEDQSHSRPLFDALGRGGAPFVLEKRYVRPDGQVVWVRNSLGLIRNPQGQPESILSVAEDITTRKQAEWALAAHARRAELLSEAAAQLITADAPQDLLGDIFARFARELEAEVYLYHAVSPDGSRLVLQHHGGLEEHDTAALREIDLGQALCGSVAIGRHPVVVEDVQQCERPEAGLVRSLGVTAYACHPLLAGSSLLGTFSFASRVRARFTPEQLRFMHTMCDMVAATLERARLVRELRQARDAAENASRAKDEFLARLSHELRTPLNPVLLVASEALENPDLPPAVRADFAIIAKNISLEARLIDDLLDLTRITRGKLSIDFRPQDLHSILHDAIATLQQALDESGVSLDLRLTSGTPTIRGDAVRLQQILWNLLQNALKFTPEGGRITVQTRCDASRRTVAVDVIDTGIGMTPEELARVFDAFAQGDHAAVGSSSRYGGVGLGLSICRMLVELHSGVIRATSDGLGRGSTFTVEFPLCAEPAPSPVRGDGPGAPAPSPSQPEKLRVLLVDDHEPTRDALVRLLQRRRYQVFTAGSVAEARRRAAEQPVDVLISDIGLPDGDGYTLMAEFRERLGLSGIALTGYGTDQDIARSQSAGFVAHLTKPVRVQALDAALAAVVGSRSFGAPADG